MLGKYDEEIDGEKKTSFVLGKYHIFPAFQKYWKCFSSAETWPGEFKH